MAIHRVTLVTYLNNVYEVESDEPYEVVQDMVLDHPERYTLVDSYPDADVDLGEYLLMDDVD